MGMAETAKISTNANEIRVDKMRFFVNMMFSSFCLLPNDWSSNRIKILLQQGESISQLFLIVKHVVELWQIVSSLPLSPLGDIPLV